MTAGENTTVYGVVSDVDVLNYAASTSELFEVTGTVIARQGVPIALPGETASDDVQLEIPEVFNLEVRIDDPVGPMNAGRTRFSEFLSRTMGTSRIGFPKPMSPWTAH